MRTLVAAAALSLAAAPAVSQDGQPLYLSLSYLEASDAPSAVEARWRPDPARTGEMLNWQLYRVAFAPIETTYDYVAVAVYQTLGAMETVDPPADDAGELVHSEIWALLQTVAAQGTDGPAGRYLAVNYMDVPADGAAEYLSVEREVWAPIHQTRADEGAIGGWALYSLVFPRGETMSYRYGTVDFFDDLDAAAAGITGAEMMRAHEGASEADLDAMMMRTDASRAIQKTELWELVAALEIAGG